MLASLLVFFVSYVVLLLGISQYACAHAAKYCTGVPDFCKQELLSWTYPDLGYPLQLCTLMQDKYVDKLRIIEIVLFFVGPPMVMTLIQKFIPFLWRHFLQRILYQFCNQAAQFLLHFLQNPAQDNSRRLAGAGVPRRRYQVQRPVVQQQTTRNLALLESLHGQDSEDSELFSPERSVTHSQTENLQLKKSSRTLTQLDSSKKSSRKPCKKQDDDEDFEEQQQARGKPYKKEAGQKKKQL